MLFAENVIRQRSIDDAWRHAMWCCVRKGYPYIVQKGSYEGQIRLQLPELMVIIEDPGVGPLAVTIPEKLGFTAPTSEKKINDYFNDYLMSVDKSEGEDYTYGEYISKQIDRAIDLLNQAMGGTNQATITIGDPNSINLPNPPCLRVISFKVVPSFFIDVDSGRCELIPGENPRLYMTVYFRSWDLFAGFPENIGGLQLLKEYVLQMLNFPIDVDDGPIIAYSDGAHLYEQYFPLVDSLNVDKVNVDLSYDK